MGQSSVFIDGLIIIHLEYSVPLSFTFFFFYKENISPNCSEQEAQAEFNQDQLNCRTKTFVKNFLRGKDMGKQSLGHESPEGKGVPVFHGKSS